MIKSLQSLRFLFALLIFLHHSALHLSSLGTFPVSFFLVLSGFVLMKSYGEKVGNISYFSFVWKRIKRIYPTYLLCLLIALMVNVSLGNPINWLNTIPSFFMLQAWIPLKDIYFAGNSVSWYVSVIVFCYAVFPFLTKCLKSNPTIIVLFGVFCYFIACFIVPVDYQHALLYVSPIFRVVDFLLGMSLCVLLESEHFHYVKEKLSKFNAACKLLLEMCVLVVCLLSIGISLKLEGPFMLAVFWWIPSLLVISLFYLMDDIPGPVTKLLHSKSLVQLGAISYAFYLLHISILILNNFFMDVYPVNYVLDGLITLFITIALAFFVTYYFEPLFSNKQIRTTK